MADWRKQLSLIPVPESISSDPILRNAMHQLIDLGRINESTGIDLFESTDFFPLMKLADMVKQSRFGKHVFFNNNLHVNTTNICVLACRFCAFRKGSRHSEAYALSVEEYTHRIEPFSSEIDEVHSVGGLHPSWTIEHYEELYSTTKDKFPHIHIKSLTAVEIKHLANRSNIRL